MREFDVRVAPATWADEHARIEHIRRHVFIEEQAVPEDLEWDGEDEAALHWLAWLGDTAIGTVRLRAGDHIGRMAVLREYRGHGVGRRLLDAAVAHARTAGAREVHLHAQVHALEFYAAAGFIAEGPEFDDAGIPHRTMRRML
ncbi:MAG: GNAT family N-acetyltransferase [Gammaproteobacteria bacterium]